MAAVLSKWKTLILVENQHLEHPLKDLNHFLNKKKVTYAELQLTNRSNIHLRPEGIYKVKLQNTALVVTHEVYVLSLQLSEIHYLHHSQRLLAAIHACPRCKLINKYDRAIALRTLIMDVVNELYSTNIQKSNER